MVRLREARLSTPVGRMVAVASPDGLCALEFDDPTRTSGLTKRFDRWVAPYTVERSPAPSAGAGQVGAAPSRAGAVDSSDPALAAVETWLADYFAGNEPSPRDLTLDLRGTPFELQVWGALLDVPYGETTSYASIANRIGRPTACRAVGLANGRNPVAIVVPCHRIVGSNGALTGYGGGLDRKQWLLRHESARAFATLF